MSKDCFNMTIPSPSDEIINDLRNMNIDFDDKEELPSEKLDRILNQTEKKFEDIENEILDIVGDQMAQLTTQFEELIDLTKELFKVLLKLTSKERGILKKKKIMTIEILQKLEGVMGCIRKMDIK